MANRISLSPLISMTCVLTLGSLAFFGLAFVFRSFIAKPIVGWIDST